MENHEIMGLFLHFMHKHRQRTQMFMDEMDLYHGQLPVLECISKNNGCTQNEVAESLNVSAPSIANSIKRLEAKGLILKEVDQNDARRSILSVTPKGVEISQKCRECFNIIDEATLGKLSDEEKEQLVSIFSKLNEYISKEED